MRLLSDRIFIKPLKVAPKTPSGLILPKKEDELEYKVCAVGIKCKGLTVGRVIHLYEHTDLTPYEDGYFMNESIGIKAIL